MVGQAEDRPAKLILMAGKPSHPPRMHEFNAGVQVLADCLNRDPRLDVSFVLNGWPKDERIFEGMAAVVFFTWTVARITKSSSRGVAACNWLIPGRDRASA